MFFSNLVDTGGTAAEATLTDITDLELRDGGEHLVRLRGDPLSMLQVAGVVIRDPQRNRVARSLRFELGKHFRDVPALRRES